MPHNHGMPRTGFAPLPPTPEFPETSYLRAIRAVDAFDMNEAVHVIYRGEHNVFASPEALRDAIQHVVKPTPRKAVDTGLSLFFLAAFIVAVIQ